MFRRNVFEIRAALAAVLALGLGACSESGPQPALQTGGSGSGGVTAGESGVPAGTPSASSSGGSSGGMANNPPSGAPTDAAAGAELDAAAPPAMPGPDAGADTVVDARALSDDAGADADRGLGDAAVATSGAPPALTGTTTAATIKVTRGTPMGKLSAGCPGFSFEKDHMSDAYFTTQNTLLVTLLELLGTGVLRIGADGVNSSVWTPGATYVTPGTSSHDVGTAEVDGLAQLLTTVGWKTLYAVNMRGASTPQTAVTELTYVIPKLGANLVAVEIGNELNLYGGNAEATWRTFAQAIRTSFPSTLIAGPGAFEDINYAKGFINAEASLIDIATHHYYRATSGTSAATVANLVNEDPNVASESQTLASLVRTNNIRDGFLFGESNSYSSHGEAGVSNTLVSALWGINLMLTTSQYGSASVYFHGGGQNEDTNVCASGPSSCTHPFYYNPLVEVDSKVTAAAPLFYGMLLVSRIGVGDMLPATMTNPGNAALRAYAVTPADGSTSVVLVNSEASTGVTATVDIGATVSSATAIYLRGPSLTSTTGVTLGEAPVTSQGTWTPQPAFTLSHTGTTLTVPVPAAAAVLVSAR